MSIAARPQRSAGGELWLDIGTFSGRRVRETIGGTGIVIEPRVVRDPG